MKNPAIKIMILSLIMVMSNSVMAQTEQELKEKEAEVRAKIEAKQRALEAKERSRVFVAPEAHSYSVGTSGSGNYVFYSDNNQSSSQLSLSKVFKDETKENKGSFNVEESVRDIRLSLFGMVESGTITIKILLPDGELLNKLDIDDSADVRFSKNIKIAEDDSKYAGEWNYEIKATKATGHYQISINTR